MEDTTDHDKRNGNIHEHTMEQIATTPMPQQVAETQLAPIEHIRVCGTAVPPTTEETLVNMPGDVLVVTQQQGPMIQKVQKTIETSQLQFIDEIECQLLKNDADTDEVQLLGDSGDAKDVINSPTLLKIGEPTEEDKEKVMSQTRKWEHGHGREEHLRRLTNRWYGLAADNQLRQCTGQGFDRFVPRRKLRPLGPVLCPTWRLS